MTTRRSFLKQGSAAAGAVGIGCNAPETQRDAAKEAAVASPQPSATFELVLGGLFLFVEDQANNLVHIVAPATGRGHVPHEMYLLFSKESKRAAQKLDRARIDLSTLAQGPLVIPSNMLDLNDVVHGKRLRMTRTCLDGTSSGIEHRITLAGGTFSKVTEECCILPGGSEFTVMGRVQWSCAVNDAPFALDIGKIGSDAKDPVGPIAAESGRILLGLVHGDPKEGLPADVEDLRSKEYPGDWNHFKAFYQCWPQVTPAAPLSCVRAGKPLAPSQCGPGRVAAET